MNMPALLVAGDTSWGDLTASADVRCLTTETFPYFHDEATHDFQGRTGLAFREQDSRQHYFAGFQGGQRLVIAGRDNGNWIILNETSFTVDPRKWYRLTVTCESDHIELQVDGVALLSAVDGRWTRGGAGVYTNTMARWRNAAITCTPEQEAEIQARAAATKQTLRKAQTETPQPVKIAEIPIPPGVAGGILPHGENFLARWADAEGRGILCCDRRSHILWKQRFDGQNDPIAFAVSDINLDGRDEIVSLDGAFLRVLDAGTGEIKHETHYPEACPFIALRGTPAKFYSRCPKLWHTAGPDKPRRIVLFAATGGGHTVWSYDHELKFRWKHHNYAGKIGHDIVPFDVNGDGRDEIVLGYYVLDDDGQIVWRVRDQELIFKQDHTDNLFCGRWDAEGKGIPKIIASCGEADYLLLDARDGSIIRQQRHLGHVQRICAGRFRHDLGGIQSWVGTDWGSPGIYMLVDEHGDVLHRHQPERLDTSAGAVTWWPDGRQLLLMQATPHSLGLWNAFGQRVVNFMDTPILDNAYSYRRTGEKKACGLSVARLPGMKTDVLLAHDEATLNIFAPEGI